MSDGARNNRHIDVTLTGEQYARLVREAERRGLTLAGYVRQRALLDGAHAVSVDAPALAADVAALRAAVEQLSADLRALVVVLAGVGAVVTDASEDDRGLMTRSALELYDKMRRLRADMDEVGGDVR
jgi:hypothetical protein